MIKTALIYTLPDECSIAQFIQRLQAIVDLQVGVVTEIRKSYYDSFDWRLYHAGMVLEFSQSAAGGSLSLLNLDYPQALMSADISQVPVFASDFESTDFRLQLTPILAMRALFEVGAVNFSVTPINVLNQDAKTIFRLRIEASKVLATRIVIQIIKGYDKEVLAIINKLQAEFDLLPETQALFVQVLALHAKFPGDYQPKLKLHFNPQLRAVVALAQIYKHLTGVLQRNHAGCIHNWDSEFVHDFRIAVRSTRVGLGRCKKIFPKQLLAEFIQFFSWLGKITGPVRDLDVYLLQFESYQALLPVANREHLEPLRELLQHKQQQAYQELAQHLQSEYYCDSMGRWQAFLDAPPSDQSAAPQAKWSVKQWADRKIWKTYKQVMNTAQVLSSDSPEEEWHDLRKSMKKLRYLIEFFQSVYPKAEMKQALKLLKFWLSSLGELQDLAVQIQTLRTLGEEQAADGASSASLQAIALLIDTLTQRQQAARQVLNDNIKSFSRAKNHRHFTRLFAPQKQYLSLDEDDE